MSQSVAPSVPSLAYILTHEAWYTGPAEGEGSPPQGVQITCRDQECHTLWDLTLRESREGLLLIEGTSGWSLLAGEHALLAELTATGDITSIDALREALDAVDAVDETVRVGPYEELAS